MAFLLTSPGLLAALCWRSRGNRSRRRPVPGPLASTCEVAGFVQADAEVVACAVPASWHMSNFGPGEVRCGGVAASRLAGNGRACIMLTILRDGEMDVIAVG